jgi:hypothetical protein
MVDEQPGRVLRDAAAGLPRPRPALCPRAVAARDLRLDGGGADRESVERRDRAAGTIGRPCIRSRSSAVPSLASSRVTSSAVAPSPAMANSVRRSCPLRRKPRRTDCHWRSCGARRWHQILNATRARSIRKASPRPTSRNRSGFRRCRRSAPKRDRFRRSLVVRASREPRRDPR